MDRYFNLYGVICNLFCGEFDENETKKKLLKACHKNDTRNIKFWIKYGNFSDVDIHEYVVYYNMCISNNNIPALKCIESQLKPLERYYLQLNGICTAVEQSKIEVVKYILNTTNHRTKVLRLAAGHMSDQQSINVNFSKALINLVYDNKIRYTEFSKDKCQATRSIVRDVEINHIKPMFNNLIPRDLVGDVMSYY